MEIGISFLSLLFFSRACCLKRQSRNTVRMTSFQANSTNARGKAWVARWKFPLSPKVFKKFTKQIEKGQWVNFLILFVVARDPFVDFCCKESIPNKVFWTEVWSPNNFAYNPKMEGVHGIYLRTAILQSFGCLFFSFFLALVDKRARYSLHYPKEMF